MSREFSLCFVRALQREIPILANTLVLSPRVSQPHVVDKRDRKSGFAWDSLLSIRKGWGRPRQGSRPEPLFRQLSPGLSKPQCARNHGVEVVSVFMKLSR